MNQPTMTLLHITHGDIIIQQYVNPGVETPYKEL